MGNMGRASAADFDLRSAMPWALGPSGWWVRL